MTDDNHPVSWAPRVSRSKLRRLYQSDAKGLLDEELLDDVGITLYLRCRSIIDVAEAKSGRIRCPSCERTGRETIIERLSMRREAQQAWMIVCGACGWTTSWKEFERSFKKRQLNSGGAMAAFRSFVESYPTLRAPKEKLLAVDRLIHEFHHSLRATPGLPTRSVGPNLIEGRLTELVPFLDELTYGAPEAAPTRSAWQQELALYRAWARAGFPAAFGGDQTR